MRVVFSASVLPQSQSSPSAFSQLISAAADHPIYLRSLYLISEVGTSCWSHSVVLEKPQWPGEKLPDEFVWDESERPTIRHDQYLDEEIPLIDLNGLLTMEDGGASHEEMVAVMVAACKDWGVFQVINHGIPQEVVERARLQGRKLFSLPLEEKLRFERHPQAISGYGATRMTNFFRSLMWSESFTMSASPTSSISNYAMKLWPKESQEFCEAFEDYDKKLRSLAMRITELLFQGLTTKPEQNEIFNSFWGTLHMNHYPPCPRPLETMGLAPHTDSSCLTIVQQGSIGGLQIMRHGAWVSVKPHPNAFIIQVGDLLQVLTNGKLKSRLHRAVVNERSSRLSLVYFFSPPPTTIVVPLTLSQNEKSLYKPLSWREYLDVKAKLFMGALDHFTIPNNKSGSIKT
ncbi:hypothetical protein O6H91_12G027200 [Diphasiastrum complanatum]|uniref:Uncharacterized protein n=1 Tax=Diphasiastrum complanatum TaxID=34168 RepID=A0ACC2BZV4_DIPCM|nr:hypothetical protein O6H91_12G027200 [Diphasiastrum complanatum]